MREIEKIWRSRRLRIIVKKAREHGGVARGTRVKQKGRPSSRRHDAADNANKKKNRRRAECCSPAEFVTVERYVIPLRPPEIEAAVSSSFTCHICHEAVRSEPAG